MTGPTKSTTRLRVLVVDDSAYTRRSIGEILACSPEVEVVGKASDGEEALRFVDALRPDAITLDLEMPRMDGFTFLRILMSTMPTPVIVISSYSQKKNVFKALELGAVDFIAKRERNADADLREIREELLSKVQMVRGLRLAGVATRPRVSEMASPIPRPVPDAPPNRVVALASSTGGPTALVELLSALPQSCRSALLIAQHMPERFTRTFAERLDRRSALRASEAEDGDPVYAGTTFVCPGRKCMRLEHGAASAELRVRISAPDASDRYVPSADKLFRSVGHVVGKRAVGVVLTGMGEDGVEGAKAIIAAGGDVVAQSEESAVVYGMPRAVVRAGIATHTLSLAEIAEFLRSLD
jgi:two-component system chemotaxis response regulator CheB